MGVHKGIFTLFLLLILWLGGKYLLPFLFPFLLGAGLAAAAEPAVGLICGRLKLPRGAAAGLGVTGTLVLLLGIVVFLGALLVRELGSFADRLPALAQQSVQLLEGYLTDISSRAPEPVGPTLTNAVSRFFHNRTALIDRAAEKVPGVLSGLLGKVPGRAMSLGTGILSGYFISARFPVLKARAKTVLPQMWQEKLLPVLTHLRQALGKWLLAQGKLMTVTYGIVTLGLWLLGIPYPYAWGLLVAAVDAIPLLGTGTVLLPWALTRLLQGSPLIAGGMVCLYLLALVTRTVLEPKFYGRHLGLDPLVMLVFLYFGYRLWGFWGIVLSPLLAAAVKVLTEKTQG